MKEEDIWAARELIFIEKSAEPRKVWVRLGRPFHDPDADAWRCTVEIEVEGDQSILSHPAAMDSMQALQFAFELIPASLDALRRRGELRWKHGGEDTGVPDWSTLVKASSPIGAVLLGENG